MAALYPIRFDPILKERPWGGRRLRRIHGASSGRGPVGESWVISDREGAVSIIGNGAFAGRSLRWLLNNYEADVLGSASARQGRFPLLVKIIDAAQPLSLQVHPPRHLATSLHGEAKTELWYVAQARPGAELFAGLRRGATRAEFEAGLRDGTVMQCIHRIPVASGDFMLVPGGRVHALGAHMMVFEIQQNSDTTYRVFDWNRVDSSGRSRELQIQNALRCIDFSDFEPGLLARLSALDGRRTLIDEDAFRIELGTVAEMAEVCTDGAFMVVGSITGEFAMLWDGHRAEPNRLICDSGVFCLVPASLGTVRLRGDPTARLLLLRPARGRKRFAG